MKTKHYIAFCLIMFLLLNTLNLEVLGAGKPAPAPKPYNPPQRPPSSGGATGGSTGSGSSSGSAAEAPEVLELNWQADSLSSAINAATPD